MTVPFNDLKRRFAEGHSTILTNVARLIDSGIFIGGQPVASFEEAFAQWCGVEHCVAVANGTDALELALRAAGIGPGHEVVAAANAGGYATVACLAVGAVPVYVDISMPTCQIDVSQVIRALTPATRAVVVTHLYGYMNDVATIRRMLDKAGRGDIVLIEDCAQAHGARLNGVRAGSLSEIASFSFYPTKNLGAIGDAGAVVCRSAELAARVRALRQYGWSAKYHAAVPGGRNSRMDPLQALILTQEIGRVDAANARRREICAFYAAHLPDGWTLVHAPDERFVGHLAVALAPDPAARERLREIFASRGIGCDVHFPVLDCDQKAWAGRGRVVGPLANSRWATDRILSLPCFPELTADELDRVADALRNA